MIVLHSPNFNLSCEREYFFENIVGKEKITGNQHYLIFQQCFLPLVRDKNHHFR